MARATHARTTRPHMRGDPCRPVDRLLSLVTLVMVLTFAPFARDGRAQNTPAQPVASQPTTSSPAEVTVGFQNAPPRSPVVTGPVWTQSPSPTTQSPASQGSVRPVVKPRGLSADKSASHGGSSRQVSSPHEAQAPGKSHPAHSRCPGAAASCQHRTQSPSVSAAPN
jgi:hypothetical protein